MNTCVKCQKEYNYKRAGGRFCSVSCGNSYRQKLKRNEQKQVQAVVEGYAIKKPLTEEEQVLWRILSGLGAEAKQLLAASELEADKRPADIRVRFRQLLSACEKQADSPLMKELGTRYEAQQQAEIRVKMSAQAKIAANSKRK